MRLSIGETAKLAGVSIRTLRHYDAIGLLKPSDVTEAGYRFYDDRKLARLQQILFYRELEFSLKEIQRILSRPDHDQALALHRHRELLVLKQQHIGELIRLVDETLGGDHTMDQNKSSISDYQAVRQQYAAEARERWGQTDAWRQSGERDKKRTDDETVRMMNEADALFSAFAEMKNRSPADPAVQQIVRQWQAHISAYHYSCTDEILQGLGELYTSDERFKRNIDRYGPGTAAFLSQAIRLYCSE